MRTIMKHRFATWYDNSLSLDADVGLFFCDRCGRRFTHSPSRILLKGESVYDCCCGYCTNHIIEADWQYEPYE